MFPFLDLKFIKIPMYGLCILTGIVVAAIVAYQFAKRRHKNYIDFVIVVAFALGIGFVCAKLLFILVTYPIKDFFKVIYLMLFKGRDDLLSGGFVFYGGAIGGVLGFLIGTKVAKCKISDFIDFFAVLIPLVHAFGRIGCFCSGCCYGIPYEGPFSVTYTCPLSTVPTGVGIFPVQLLESALLFILSGIMYILFMKNVKNLIFGYFISYGIIRLITENFRFDAERGFILGLSTSQFISILIILVSIILLIIINVINRRKAKQNS